MGLKIRQLDKAFSQLQAHLGADDLPIYLGIWMKFIQKMSLKNLFLYASVHIIRYISCLQ